MFAFKDLFLLCRVVHPFSRGQGRLCSLNSVSLVCFKKKKKGKLKKYGWEKLGKFPTTQEWWKMHVLIEVWHHSKDKIVRSKILCKWSWSLEVADGGVWDISSFWRQGNGVPGGMCWDGIRRLVRTWAWKWNLIENSQICGKCELCSLWGEGLGLSVVPAEGGFGEAWIAGIQL